MEWRDKLYDHEVPPPENLWSKISHDLDNDDFVVFKQNLFHYEETPADNLWDKISQDLDNDSFVAFKQSLFHHEEAPPENLWNKISQDLDNGPFVVFKQNLFHHGEVPPSSTWQNIEQALYPDPMVVPVSSGKNTFRIWRVAAAAAIIGIAFVTVNYFLSGTDTAIAPVAKKQTVSTASQSHISATTIEQAAVPDKKISTATIASRFVPRKSRSDMGGSSEHIPAVYSDGGDVVVASLSTIPEDEDAAITDKVDLSSETNRRIRNLRGEIREDVSLLDLPNSYFLMTGPNGQTVRVSSKFRNTIQYLNNTNNEEFLDVILRESQYWKNIFTEWKQKVVNSSFVPSAQNFMDISELMNLLQQNHDNK